MSYRTVYVRSAEKLSLRSKSLIVTKEDKREVMIPLEDISMILIEDQRSILTTRLIASLSSYYIGLIVCDERYMPASITLPLHMHYKQLYVFGLQMDVKKPFNSQLWEMIIRSKIINQRDVIQMTTKDEFTLEKLKELEKEIKSGDKTNREASAAKIFFDGIYGKVFTRRQKNEDAINASLNYGYTILAANMSRILAMYGFNTILGIHHCSMSNNFNLSYDMMEPFRPIVDRYVYFNLDNLNYPLTTDVKKGLINLLYEKVRIKNKIFSVEYAMEEMVLSYIKALETENSKMLLVPKMVENEIEEEDNELFL